MINWPLRNPSVANRLTRRLFSGSILGLIAGNVCAETGSSRSPHGAGVTPTLPYGPAQDLAAVMAIARRMRDEALANGDQGYGAAIVRDGVVIGLGPSRVVSLTDPTAHAELNAIRDAAHRLGSRDLSGCLLVSTSRPCQMCETAAYWARIDGMVAGNAGESAQQPQYSRCN